MAGKRPMRTTGTGGGGGSKRIVYAIDVGKWAISQETALLRANARSRETRTPHQMDQVHEGLNTMVHCSLAINPASSPCITACVKKMHD